MDDSEGPYGDHQDFGISDVCKMVKSCVTGAFSSSEEEGKPVKWDPSNEYDFGHRRRGVALIVCNEQFDGNQSNRKGADLDADHFENVFKKLGFQDIRVKCNMTAEDMKDWFTAVSKEDHSDADCLAVAITSHGEQELVVDYARYNVTECKDTILGSQGAVYTEELVSKFADKNCPTLAGKPKIFLLQACRGQKLDKGVVVQEDVDEVDAFAEPEYTISPAPCYKDFCLVYATPPGHFAFRRPSEGSWFVKALRDVVEKTDPGKVNFHKLLTKVVNKVAREYQSSSANPVINEKKQAGCIYSMLTKDIFFTRKPEPEEEIMV